MAPRRDVDGSLGVFASELRYARTRAGLSQEELASKITYSSSLVSREAVPSWFREWVEIEREATTLRSWHPTLIAGLLQIPEYAHEVLRRGHPASSDAEIEQRLQLAHLLDMSRPALWVTGS